jgi:hypothetical protein
VFTSPTTLEWEGPAPSGSDTFHLYRGLVPRLAAGDRGACFRANLASPAATDAEIPAAGAPFFYLVTGRNAAGEGPMGTDSAGRARVNATPCP